MPDLEKPDVWGIVQGMNAPGCMRTTNGAPMMKLYEIINVETNRPIAEMWIPTSAQIDRDALLAQMRQEAILIGYAPVMFWTLNSLANAVDRPEAVKEIATVLLEAMREQHEKLKEPIE